MSLKSKPKNKYKLHLLSLISFLLGFQAALVAYVTSSYLQQRVGESSVGFFYFLGYGASLVVLLQMHHLIRKHGKSKVFFLFIGMKLISLLGVAFFSKSWLGVMFATWVLLSGQLMWTALDIIIENFSTDAVTGSIRGRHLAIMNGGWLLAPFLAAKLVEKDGYHWVYYLGAAIVFFVFILAFRNFRKVNHNINSDPSVIQVVKKLIRNKDIGRIYYVSLILEIFYATMVVYTPLYLLDLGYGWDSIGKIFTVMLVPFVIFQYPMGILADKKTGEKEWLMVSVIIMAIATAFVGIIGQADLIAWMVVLFFTRVGACIIEVMRDTYFFKKITASDVDLMDFYRTTRSLSYIIAAAVFSCLIFFLPVRAVFLILALITLTALIPLWHLRDTR